MSTLYAKARTNDVTVIDMEGLTQSVKKFGVTIQYREDNKVVFFPPDNTTGDFNYSIDDGDTGDNIEFNWESNVMPFIKENEILFVFCIYYDQLREIGGDTQAYIRNGDKVESLCLRLDDIYNMAKDKFKVNDFTRCEY
jgi:hypothetical protein